jgi:GMP synthase (glutamine-hydrolysing)
VANVGARRMEGVRRAGSRALASAVRILAIIHELDDGPGVFLEPIRAAGHDLDPWLIAREPDPPRDLGEYDAVLTFGGSMHPDQERQHPWLAEETALLATLLERRVAVLGVCLGAQLLAAAAGAEVRRAAMKEIGWYEVRITDEGADDGVIGPLAPAFQALEWHSYEFALPAGAVPLAESDVCLQAFRISDSAWGIQFHAEVTGDDFESWMDDYPSDPAVVAQGSGPEELYARTREQIADWNEIGRRLCARFLALAESGHG